MKVRTGFARVRSHSSRSCLSRWRRARRKRSWSGSGTSYSQRPTDRRLRPSPFSRRATESARRAPVSAAAAAAANCCGGESACRLRRRYVMPPGVYVWVTRPAKARPATPPAAPPRRRTPRSSCSLRRWRPGSWRADAEVRSRHSAEHQTSPCRDMDLPTVWMPLVRKLVFYRKSCAC